MSKPRWNVLQVSSTSGKSSYRNPLGCVSVSYVVVLYANECNWSARQRHFLRFDGGSGNSDLRTTINMCLYYQNFQSSKFLRKKENWDYRICCWLQSIFAKTGLTASISLPHSNIYSWRIRKKIQRTNRTRVTRRRKPNTPCTRCITPFPCGESKPIVLYREC